ncbi:MAG: NB-ARC domain-containing protein [Chitinophagales bacterium]
MIIHNRRDAGYTIISRFEEEFREFLFINLSKKYENYLDNIPRGIITKAQNNMHGESPQDIQEFFENIDFPDLKEISTYKDHFQTILKLDLSKKDFNCLMDSLYQLRCKIAHIKGYFTSIDLEKLIEFTSTISKSLDLKDFNEFIFEIKTNPQQVIIKIPTDFLEDYLDSNGIINNLPIPDYEYEGGFVGRDEDRKTIKKYLYSEKFPVVTLTGSGGVGKTSLALKVIQDITESKSENKFDVIIWLSAKENQLSAFGIEDIEPTLKNYEELLDTIIDLFGFRQELLNESTEQKLKLVEQLIDVTDKTLLVIDNLETITDQRIINFIFDAPLKIKFLVTSRKGIGQLERRYELKELKAKEAIFLFRQIARDKQLPTLGQLPNNIIKNYVQKVSYYPLAIKWVVGQVARGKDINNVVDNINTSDSDISKFCYEQIFSTLSSHCKKVIYTISLLSSYPTASILQYITEIEQDHFEDIVEELILASLVIPEQYKADNNQISTKYTLLPLTKGYTRLQLNQNVELRELLLKRINEVEKTVTTTERAKKEYRHSLYNYGAKTDEEKIATIIAQTAYQKYQSGFYDAAVSEYKRATKLAPKFAPLFRNWAIMESYEGHLLEAEKLMEKASSLDNTDPQIFLIWGNIYRKNSKYTEAHKKYQIAYELAPDDPIILNAFGQSKGNIGDFKEANILLNKALQPDSEFSSMKHEIINRTSIAKNLINWGDSFKRDRNYGQAEKKYLEATQECHKILSLNTRDTKIHDIFNKANLKLGLLYIKSNNKLDKKEGVKFLDKIISRRAESFKQGVYKITSISELLGYFDYLENTERVLQLLNIFEQEFRYSTILKRANYKSLNEKILRIRDKYSKRVTYFHKGSITSINTERGFVIIQKKGSKESFFGHINNFLSKSISISKELKGKEVNYIPFYNNKFKRKEAIKIKITNTNKRYNIKHR